MDECNGCVWQKNACGIISHPNIVSKKYQKKCMCKHCILKANCSDKCNIRNIFIEKMIIEINRKDKQNDSKRI
jgi:hypothetical protein